MRQTEFLAPHDLQTCVDLLRQHHEARARFAFPWEFRSKIEVSAMQEGHADFKMSRIMKNQIDFLVFPTFTLRGTLVSQSDNHTQVSAKAYVNRFMYVWNVAPLGISAALLPDIVLVTMSQVILAVLVTIIALALSLWLGRFWLDWRSKKLIGILTEALGG